MNCFECDTPLTIDDRGAYLKFWDRDGVDMVCIPCLCLKLRCSESYLRERIQFLKDNGCTLFSDKKN